MVTSGKENLPIAYLHSPVVYFVEDEATKLVKIGHSADVGGRVSALRATVRGRRLKLLAACPGDRALEERLHRYFGHLRRRGEWFEADAELREFIEGVSAEDADAVLQPVRKGVGAIPRQPRTMRISEALYGDLGRLVQQLEEGGYRTSRAEILEALLWSKLPTDADAARKLVGRWRRLIAE